LARISAANVVRVCNLGVETDGRPYLVMDYIEGEGLDKIIERDRIVCLRRFRELFGQACDALQAVHRCNILHRNINPSNFLISPAAKETELLTLVGFSFARSVKKTATEQVGEVVGNPYYMSPEQCLGADVDHRSDIYSLGCCMFAALTGSPPFQGNSMVEVMSMHISEQPVLTLTDIPDFAPVQAVILRCLEKKPEDRFQSVAELSLALVGQPVKTKPSGFLRGLKVWGK
jgi:serine/threonine protein kinase